MARREILAALPARARVVQLDELHRADGVWLDPLEEAHLAHDAALQRQVDARVGLEDLRHRAGAAQPDMPRLRLARPLYKSARPLRRLPVAILVVVWALNTLLSRAQDATF